MDKPEPQVMANREPPCELLPKLASVDEEDDVNELQHGPFTAGASVQDRVFSAIFHQMFPQDYLGDDKVDAKADNPAAGKTHARRPNFSLPLMSSNFRKLNARLGIVFVAQANLTRLLSWKAPTQTVSFLVIYTFCCLEPHLLAIVPLALCLLFIMIPAFVARHPPPPDSLSTDAYEISGPASARPPELKPAPDMSKDFFRNMRDLQNSMGDMVALHDGLVDNINPVTNFSDERLSSALFLAIFSASTVVFFASRLIPWRAVIIVSGWLGVGALHPRAVELIRKIDTKQLRRLADRGQASFRRWAREDIVLDGTPERREVEVFELQHRREDAWEPWLYAVAPYTPRSPLRVSGDRPRGTRFFEDVRPPRGWEWSSKKWALDLASREWVEERMIVGVEVEVDGERWVYDIVDDAEETLGDNAAHQVGGRLNTARDWEEGSGVGAKGTWRRRRWTRRVQRRVVTDADETAAVVNG